MTDHKRKVIGQALARVVERARGGFERIAVGLMTCGSELGSRELLDGALLAMAEDPRLNVVAIGPKTPGYEELQWLESGGTENDLAAAMEKALSEGRLQGAVALHYPFPLGVTTIGRALTPARGRAMLVASTTGASAAQTSQAMLLNALYGIAVAKSLNICDPSLGVLNVNGAGQTLRALGALGEGGYHFRLGASQRAGGGAILRGNDILDPTVDICLCDSLTGNLLMKLFSAWNTGGAYEASGWGYGPSTGRDWRQPVSIISRASGAPVVAGALKFTAAAARGDLPGKVAAEIAAAEKAGLSRIMANLLPAPPAGGEEIKAPPARPAVAEILGVDALDMETAVTCLWREGLYAESTMGCTGPLIRVPLDILEEAREVLKLNGYI